MLRLIALLLGTLRSAFRSRADLMLENLALRQQLAVFAHSERRPRIAERWIGSVRRELIGHVVVCNERHLRRLLRDYVAYYHEDRTHLGLEQGTPAERPVGRRPAGEARVVSLPRVGGLHHRYEWRAAA